MRKFRSIAPLSIIAICVGMVFGAPVSSSLAGDRTAEDVEEEREAVSAADTLKPYVESISESLSDFEMRPVPGGTVTVETEEGTREIEVDPFWIAKTEVKWAPYQTFVYGRDQEEGGGDVDAVSRPTNAFTFIAANFGGPREGHPARAITRKAARNYARWIAQKTNRNYRLPTAAEWIQACRAGLADVLGPSRENLDEYAWHGGNSGDQSHPVGSKSPDALGVHDLLGNLAEWTFTPEDSTRHVVRGGSYRSSPDDVHCTARVKEQTQAWKRTDPQLPKSEWWFSDAPFVGLRVVRVPGGG